MQTVKTSVATICAFTLLGCVSIKTLDYPGAEVVLNDESNTDRPTIVFFAAVDFFDEDSKDPEKVCSSSTWESKVDKNGVALFNERASTKFVNLFNAEDSFDKVGRGVAACVKRESGKIEYLSTLPGSDTMFAAGSKLKIVCVYSANQWHCTKTNINN